MISTMAFTALNFEVYEGPEISSEIFEFDHMKFPPDHPARESMDTYWLDESNEKSGKDRLCLRPHLTGASVRYMREHAPPFRFVYPGHAYRNESTDTRHERAFFNTRYSSSTSTYRSPLASFWWPRSSTPFSAGRF
ncbi:MAG: hypothetical protein ACRDQY_09060 [Pseudonocardiaceae bacterium]